MSAVMERTEKLSMGSKRPIIKFQAPVDVNRGEVWWVEFDGVGSEQQGIRPALVISNQKGNRFGPTVIVAAITAQMQKAKLPTHVRIHDKEMLKDSFVMLEQVRTIDKSRLIEKITSLDNYTMLQIKKAHEISCSDVFS